MDEKDRPIPDAVLDYWLRKLTPHEFRMLVYLLQKTYCVRCDFVKLSISETARELRTTAGIINLDLDGLLSENLINLMPDEEDGCLRIVLREWIFLNRFPDGWDDN
jgi:DNA-binding MarR family transcriptional regulator